MEGAGMAVSSSLKRHGGKAYLAKKIRALFPPHTRYCETHFGSGAVLLAGDGEGVAEFANDLDKDLSNFWDVLGVWTHFVQFKQKCEATPFSEPAWERAVERLKQPWISSAVLASLEDVIDRAHAFFTVNRQSRQALGKDFATPTSRLRRGMNEQVSAWLSAVDGLPEMHARLRRVEIRCMDAVEFIRELDSPETLFYCDPPYMAETRRDGAKEYGPHEMTVEQHRALLFCLSQIKGKFVLSGYPNELYDQWEKSMGFCYVDHVIDNKASGKKEKEKKIERLWMNFKPETAV